MDKTIVVRSEKVEQVTADWGQLTWYANSKLGNSREMTLGICVIKPDQCNPLHSHPNCAEILRVAQGRIMHTTETGEVEMNVGDVISVAVNFPHHARNIGDCDAVLQVAFTSADRQTKGE